MNFAIIPFDDPEYDLLDKVKTIDPGVYVRYAPRIYFVRFSGTAESLASDLGFSGKTRSEAGIVLPAKGYYGFGKLDLWEWLKQ